MDTRKDNNQFDLHRARPILWSAVGATLVADEAVFEYPPGRSPSIS